MVPVVVLLDVILVDVVTVVDPDKTRYGVSATLKMSKTETNNKYYYYNHKTEYYF